MTSDRVVTNVKYYIFHKLQTAPAERIASIARKGSTTLRPDTSMPPPPPPPPVTLPLPLKRKKSRKSLNSDSSAIDANAVALSMVEDDEADEESPASRKPSRTRSIAGKVASVTHVDQAQKAFKSQVVERISRKKSTTKNADGSEKIEEEIKTSITAAAGDAKSDISKLSDDPDVSSGEEDSKLAPPKTGLKKIQSNFSGYGDAVVDNVTDNPVTSAIDKLLIKLKVKKAKPGAKETTRAERMKRRRRKRRRTRRRKKASVGAPTDPNEPHVKQKFWQKITKRKKAKTTPTEDDKAAAAGDAKSKKPGAVIKQNFTKVTQSVTNIGPLRKLSKRRKKNDEKDAATAAALAAAADDSAAGKNAAGDAKTVLVVDEKVEQTFTDQLQLTESALKLQSRRQTKFSKITGAPSAVGQKASNIIKRKSSKPKSAEDGTTDGGETAKKEDAKAGEKKSFMSRMQSRTPSRLRRKKKKSAAGEDAVTTDGETPATTTDDEKADGKKRGPLTLMKRVRSKASLKSGEAESAGDGGAGKSGPKQFFGAAAGGAQRSFSKLPGMKPKTKNPTLQISGEDEDGNRISTNASTSTRELGILPSVAKADDASKKSVKTRAQDVQHSVAEKGGKFASAAKNLPKKQVDKLMGNKKPEESPSEVISKAQEELIVSSKVVVTNNKDRKSSKKSMA